MSPSRKRPSKPSVPASSSINSPASSPQPELKAPIRPIPPTAGTEESKPVDDSSASKDDSSPKPEITTPIATVSAEEPKSPDTLAVASEINSESSISPPPRQHPIPPPSEPMQYRAIGLVRGRYIPSEDKLSQGILKTSSEDFDLPAILLGRVVSLVKNHLNLERDYLWVVYPRFFSKPRSPQILSLQILGVWEPALLNRLDEQEDAPDLVESAEKPVAAPPELADEPQSGYFSIRGEVVAFSEETQEVTVSIRQTPRKTNQTAKSFKLPLKGTLSGKVLGHFWDLDVQQQQGMLVIREGTRIGFIAPKKRTDQPASKGKPAFTKRSPNFTPPTPNRFAGDKPVESLTRREPPSKPVKKSRPPEEN